MGLYGVTFDFPPCYFLVMDDSYPDTKLMVLRGMRKGYLDGQEFWNRTLDITWSGNNISWYNTESQYEQLNDKGAKYFYFCIG